MSTYTFDYKTIVRFGANRNVSAGVGEIVKESSATIVAFLPLLFFVLIRSVICQPVISSLSERMILISAWKMNIVTLKISYQCHL